LSINQSVNQTAQRGFTYRAFVVEIVLKAIWVSITND